MHYTEFRPNPRLASLVECFWLAQSIPGRASHHGIVPGGYSDLVFNAGGEILVDSSREVFAGRDRTYLAGPADSFRCYQVRGRIDLLGVRFHLNRAFDLLRLPIIEAQNRAAPLAQLMNPMQRVHLLQLESDLVQAVHVAQRIRLMESFLLQIFNRQQQWDGTVEQAIRLIANSGGRVTVAELTGRLGVSARQLERKFNCNIGLSPKTFCRVVRFQHVKQALGRDCQPRWRDLTYEFGYYDQTQLIREFRLFTGQTPTRYQQNRPVGFFLYRSAAHR